MNEFEKRTRAAMADLRHRTTPAPRFPGPLGSQAAEVAGVSFGIHAMATKLRPDEPDIGLDAQAAIDTRRETEVAAHGIEIALTTPALAYSRSALRRPGLLVGTWSNPLIAAAIPAVLLAERVRDQRQLDLAMVRSQFVREIQQFQQELLKNQVTADEVEKLAYLLCSFVDETCLSTLDTGGMNLSLLVEFYRNAWGGEKCFDHLQHYLGQTPQDKHILALYDLVLSLGFEGKYKVIERGQVLLADLRKQLNHLLYSQSPTQTLADARVEKVVYTARCLTPMKLLGYGALLMLLVYGSAAWRLHEQSQTLRTAILAWTPPTPRKIDIMETLPQPLPGILSEGWLEVRSDPRGWLLIFTSDGAFATGQAKLSQEFKSKRNIERLGEALAPWPGDLEVIGHTDNKPYRNAASNSNQKLSEGRAQVVADKIRESMQGSKYQRSVTSVGKGDSEPLASNDSEQGRSRNRRVDILWKIGERENSAPPVDFTHAAPRHE
ncbi:type IVB secretion system protein IcmH/DotU [Pseudomonas chlororaphis]|uniref:Type VI secretion protein, TssL family n=1 Tax=Pseudomonas chlororaphis O6 TaxID=1037915 RepID=A0AB33X011_9PSED|nr:type IVB secretion system protein IcmH/DotU [Pseudomonas chlororaphis]EIM18739.1 type VI secretion protein, TssL family [Pseudomonas chlororaphis O6]